MKILVVDDEPLFVEFIKKYLDTLGYQDVATAASGIEALRIIDRIKQPFDCFLFDIRMPGLDGIELCQKVRAKSTYAATPILMITSMTEKSYIDRAFLAGANDYITKPIDRAEISARVGMVEALVAERKNTLALLQQLDDPKSKAKETISFEEPISLEEIDCIVPISSLENYLLRLGKLRLFSSSAVGFHVENADLIFAKTERLEFVDVLSEVAVAIKDSLKDSQTLLTYAGSGDFCAVQSRTRRTDPDELEMLINDTILQRLEVVAGSDLSVPRVRVGTPAANGLMSFNDPTHIIFQSIEDARQRKNTKYSASRLRTKGLRDAG